MTARHRRAASIRATPSRSSPMHRSPAIIGPFILGAVIAGTAGILLFTQQPASAATPVPATVCYAAATGPCMGFAP